MCEPNRDTGAWGGRSAGRGFGAVGGHGTGPPGGPTPAQAEPVSAQDPPDLVQTKGHPESRPGSPDSEEPTADTVPKLVMV